MIVAFDADDTLWHNEDRFTESHRAIEALLAEWTSASAIEVSDGQVSGAQITWAHEVEHDDHLHEVPTLDRLGELPGLPAGWT